jgi:hypothetical protein
VTDIVVRILRAIPLVEAWIRELHHRHAGRARRAATLGLPRLNEAWPAGLLNQASAVAVPKAPFPPVVEYDLPEFEAMAQASWAGITFGTMYFVDEAQATEGTHFHELCHVAQWNTLGVREFLLTYALGILLHGYEASPFEAIAYDLQLEFESGQTRTGLVDVLERHALEANKRTRDIIQSQFGNRDA